MARAMIHYGDEIITQAELNNTHGKRKGDYASFCNMVYLCRITGDYIED